MKQIFVLFLLLNGEILVKTEKHEKVFNLNQNDYQLKYQRLEMVRYNKDYLKDVSVVTYKYNRTTPVTNFTGTFKVDIGNSLEMIIQAFKLMSNEYREFPMHFGVNACKAIAANAFGCAGITKCGNFTGCPFLKGRKFHICNWSPEQLKFPPFLPNGDYKIEIQAMHLSVEVYVMNGYMSVTRPIPWY